jgi:hypothetical protein
MLAQALVLLDAGRPAGAAQAMLMVLAVNRSYDGLDSWLLRAHATQGRAEAARLLTTPMRSAEESPPTGKPKKVRFKKAVAMSMGTLGLAEAAERAGYTLDAGDAAAPDDHYQTLRVSTDWTPIELKAAYKRAGVRTHPDKLGGDTAAFQNVAAAFDLLRDPARRKKYDEGADLDKTLTPRIFGGSRMGSGSLAEEVARRYFGYRFPYAPFGDSTAERDNVKWHLAANTAVDMHADL